MRPRVSIVLPFRDEESTIGDALDSIARQTLPEYELLAINDRSVDGSVDIVRVRAARDARIRLIAAPAPGLVAALNAGVAESRAELLARMDADDLMHPERLEAQLSFLAGRSDVSVVGCQVSLFPEGDIQAGYREYVRWQNACVEPERIAAEIYFESPLAHPSVVMRKEALLQAGGYRHGDFPEDYELWLRMHAAGMRFGKVPRVLLHWRERAARASRTDPRYAREAFDRIRAHYLGRDPRVRSERPVAIWGAGRKTRLRARWLLAAGIRPAAWIDIDPRKIGHHVDGAVIHRPEWLVQDAKPFVLLYLTRHGAREIAGAWLEAHGYRLGEDWVAVG